MTNAPYATPHNIPDEWTRNEINEPSNLSWILRYMAQSWDLEEKDLAAQVWANTLLFFSLQEEQGEFN
jgi:Tat protein secretion system quality control protein TatD with DNase activity